jgi:hypothetical protein
MLIIMLHKEYYMYTFDQFVFSSIPNHKLFVQLTAKINCDSVETRAWKFHRNSVSLIHLTNDSYSTLSLYVVRKSNEYESLSF